MEPCFEKREGVVDNNWRERERERKGAIKRKLASVRRNKGAREGRLCEELKGGNLCRGYYWGEG